MQHQGGCLCGDVRYETEGAPGAIHVCYCGFCQRATGSGNVIEPLFPSAHLSVTQGAPQTYDQRSGGSGKIITIHFCGRCGTKLYQTFERFPDLLGVYGGTYDDPTWFGLPKDTTRFIFAAKAPAGTIIPAGYRIFEDSHRNADGSIRDGAVYDTPYVVGGAPG